MTAEIITLPERDDDTIPVKSGLPLADADAGIIGRRLAREDWEMRVHFFNNILCDSLDNMTTMGLSAIHEDDTLAWFDWGLLQMHERIGQSLELWGETKPTEDMAAVLYAASLNPIHRKAAAGYFKRRGRGGPSQQVNEIATDFEPFRVFYNLSDLARPGLGLAWRQGVPEDCDARFRDPEDAA